MTQSEKTDKTLFTQTPETDPRFFQYQSPLTSRYASKNMSQLFSEQTRITTFRKIWIALAQSEKNLGLNISDEQIQQLKDNVATIDFEKAAQYEKELRHDVMAHVHTYGDQCPLAKPIIHLGATSCTITDNADLMIYKQALQEIKVKVLQIIQALAQQANIYKTTTCLGFTHFQPAQPTTVGKRICLWLQDFMLDLEALNECIDNLAFLGIKGATGTQASFMQLFHGDESKVIALEKDIAQQLGFKKVFPISGQTYTRKQDAKILYVLKQVALSAHKMSNDFRLLAHLKELEEPFEAHQIGSSAMPYKRNPMMNERIGSLARYVIALSQNPDYTAATQWLERSLDDSANRRLAIPEAFLSIDGILQLVIKISRGLIVNEKIIQKHLDEELPFMITESLLMQCPDRQYAHEKIRQHSHAAAQHVKDGGTNDLLERIIADPELPLGKKEVDAAMNSKELYGRAPQQVDDFLSQHIYPLLEKEQFETSDIDIKV